MQSADRPWSHPLTRRTVLGLGVGAFVVAVAPLAVGRRQTLTHRAVPVMGTIAELTVVHHDPHHAQAAIDAAVEELRRVDRTMTRHAGGSEVGRVNLGAAARPVPVGPATAAVLREALAWAESSDGAFDPCVGRAIQLWDVTTRTTPPPATAVRRLAGRRLYRALDLDRRGGESVVRFTDPDVALDLGGIAKGYGVDRAVDALRAGGIAQAVVNVGGDLYALGTAPGGAPWRIGIRAPEASERLAGKIEVSDAAVATSGDYLQYFNYGGRRYHHLLNPVTAEPWLTPVHSVTVVASSCLYADTAATTVYGMEGSLAVRVLAARAPGARVVSVITERA